MEAIYWMGLIVATILFFGLGWALNSFIGKKSLYQAKIEAELILENSKIESENLKKEKLLEAEEEFYQTQQNLEEDYKNKSNSLKKFEQDLNLKDSNIDRKADLIEKKERDLNNFQRDISNKEKQLIVREDNVASLIKEHNTMLERVAAMTTEEARQILMNNLRDEAKKNIARSINKMIEEANEDAKKKARDIVISAIQRAGIDIAIESTATVINLTTVAEAIGLVNALGYDNVGIQPDIHHMNMVEGSIPGAFRAAGELVRHVHINETNLYSLGTGLADFNAIMRALMEIGFEGYLSVYMPLVSQEVYQMAPVGYGRSSSARGSGTGARPDLPTYLGEAIGYLKEIEEAVGRQRRLYDADSAYC